MFLITNFNLEVMDIIFIGSVYPSEREDEIRHNSKCGIDNASNNFQWALLAGLDFYYPDIRIITQPAIRTYPLKYNKLFFKNSIFSHKPGSMDYCIGFINVPILKHFVKTINLYKTLKKTIDPSVETTVIIYAVHSPYLKALIELKRNNVNLKTCLIVPDLPQFMSESRNPIYRLLKSIDSILINKYLKSIDSFVLLSEYMTEPLKVGKRPWTRIEGIFNSNTQLNTPFKKELQKTILYSGSIGKRNGINTLLKAFSLIEDKNYRLWIRGNGSTKEKIIEASETDFRIKYFEEMSKNDLFELQKKATVLINPVPSKEKFTKYFFPSKTMDYMASGTPTIMTRIKSIPQEYLDYAFVVEVENAEGLKEKIVEICSKEQSELDEFGRKAAKFIFENKNPISQVKKIYELLNSIDENKI
jgi:glycosyltransferase involved in cell wall biosynthesis